MQLQNSTAPPLALHAVQFAETCFQCAGIFVCLHSSLVYLCVKKVSPLLHSKSRYVSRIAAHELRPSQSLLFSQLLGINRLLASRRVR